MDLELRGLNAVVTGATRGIGRAIADLLLAEGCRLAICARTDEEVRAMRDSYVQTGATCLAECLDVSNLPAFQRWCNLIERDLGRVDILIWNVSAQSRQLDESFRVDLISFADAIEALLPLIRRSRVGAIVAIGSQAALLPVPGYKSYAAAKAALLSYCGSLARELAPEQIRVNVVSPGEVYHDTGIWGRLKRERPERYEQALKKNIMGRLCSPEEVAKVAVFLSSPAASFVTGSNILVDGMSREFINY